MRILIIDDHPLMADALRLALLTLGVSTEVETANALASGLARAGREPAIGLALLDLGLPECSGVEALVRFREQYPELPVVVVSGSSDAANILTALDLGAMGFIPKTSPRELLLNAVRLVVSGGIYVPHEVLPKRSANPESATRPATATLDRATGGSAPMTPAQLGVSPRQAEVLTLMLKGLSNKLIARKLDISENTTKVHVSAVLRTLGVSTRTQALVAASRLGLRLDA